MNAKTIQRTIAAAAAAALIITAPGLPCYQAAAQTVSGNAGAAVRVGAGAAGAAAGRSPGAVAPVTLGAAPLQLPGAASPLAILPAPVAASANAPAAEPAAPEAAPAMPARAALPAPSIAPLGAADAPSLQPAAREGSALGLLQRPDAVSMPSAEIAALPAGAARTSGDLLMDRVLAARSIEVGADAAPAAGVAVEARGSGLLPPGTDAGTRNLGGLPPNNFGGLPTGPQGEGPGARRSFLKAFLISAGSMGLGAAAILGAQAAAVMLAPTIFGLIPGAALWAVSSALLVAPVAVYSRYRLALRDSPRLHGVKLLVDFSLGALGGAVAVALPGILTGAALVNATWLLPLAIVGGGAALAAGTNFLGLGLPGQAGVAILSLAPLAGLLAGAAAGPLTLGSLLGLMTMPALTTVSFFLGRIVQSAESGQPFSVPGAIQTIRFPIYTWVMTGVVFALLTGYVPFWANAVFIGWMLLGSTKYFNWAYLGAAAFSIATGFASPVTFFAIAFLPERAAVWTEALLGRLLKAGAPAPSTGQPVVYQAKSETPQPWPVFRHWLKTFVLLGALAGFGGVMAATVFGFGALAMNLGVAGVMAAIPFFFAKKLVKAMMKAEPTDETKDPEVFAIMSELRERINAERAAKGKKAIPMPEIVNIPAAAMPVPNAFATGSSPFNALVGVTAIFKGMTLEPESLRKGLVNLLKDVDPASKSFKVFRKAIRGSLPGIPPEAAPQAVSQAVLDAEAAQLKQLGYRVMRGVMGHEFNHVMHRDMLLGAIASSMSSGIAFSSYGVLWAVGHAQYLAKRAWDLLRGARTDSKRSSGEEEASVRAEDGRARPEFVDPVSTGVALKTIAGLVKVFAALWAPILATILHMAESRQRESHADEGGAQLTEDAESLALGLGLLTTWRPARRSLFDFRRLPFVAATAQLFTVNPARQLDEAGLLGAEAARGSRPVERADNAFFNLFITHPDTTRRIEELYDMALAAKSKPAPPAGGRFVEDGTRNLGPLRGMTLSRAGEGDEAGAVDGDTDEGLHAPGLDQRMVPIVEVLRAGIESDPKKYERLGHLSWALQEHLNRGGVVRYTGLMSETQMIASHFDAPSKALYLNAMFRRANPKLQAALLASQLQEVYDHLNDRAGGTQESMTRRVLVLDAFLDGADMASMAAAVDINNPLEPQLFEMAVQQRSWAASGLAAFDQVFGQLPTVPQLFQKAQDHVSLLRKQLADLKDQSQLVTEGLRAAPDVGLEQQGRVLAERIKILQGAVALAEAQLAMVEKETLNGRAVAGQTGVSAPLAIPMDGRRSRLDLSKLKTVAVRAKPQIDPQLERVVALIKETIATSADPEIRKLSYIIATLDRLVAQGGRVMLASSGEGAAAYFSPVTLDLVVGRQFANTHPALVAAMMVHELTHAADYFDGRPLTRETEKNAFTNEAIFAGAFDPEEIAAALDVRNPMERAAYSLIYHARTKYVEGNTSLEAMISQAYTQLFGAHFQGLQTATQLLEETRRQKLEPLREHHEQLKQRAGLVGRAALSGDPMRRLQHENMQRVLALQAAHIRLLERQVEQLEGIAADEQESPAASMPAATLAPAPRMAAPTFSGPKPGGAPPSARPSPSGIQFFGPHLGMRPPPGHAPPGDARAHRDPHDVLLPPTPSFLPQQTQTDDANAPRPGAFPSESPETAGGALRRVRSWLSRPFRVLPDPERNREFWKYTWGQALLALGVAFHYTALPGLVAPSKEDSAKLGVNRAVNWGSQAFSNLVTGPLVDRTSIQKVLVWTFLGRALLLLAVPILFFQGHLTFAVFLAIIFAMGFLQSTGITAGSVAYARILAEDEPYYNKANAVFNLVVNVVGVIGPLLAGSFIGLMDQRYGLLSGNALSYAVYGVFALAAAVSAALLRIPRDELVQARRELAASLRSGAAPNPRVKGITATRENGRAVLLVEVSGDPATVAGVPEVFSGFRVQVIRQRRLLAELGEGFRILWSVRFLRLALAFSTLNYMAADSLVFTALPRYIADVLGPGTAAAAALQEVPVFGPMVTGLTSKAGAFGLYLASASLGFGVSSLIMALARDPAPEELQRRLEAFKRALEPAEPSLSAEQRAAAAAAVRRAIDAAWADYRARWAASADFAPTAEEFRRAITEEAARRLDADVFGGRRGAAGAARLLEATGLAAALGAWSERRFAGMARQERREARGGLDRLERQGVWTSLLLGAGSLAYWGVFFSPALWPSVAAMLSVAFLQGFAAVVWSSLYQRVLMATHPESLGKAYASMYFYQLSLSILGVLFFGWLMAAVATPAALWIVGGVMTAIALMQLAEPFVVFPINRGKKNGP